ncbi:hypothetical protein SBRCBS47491_004461 [Sporothrix bragantina]|uniref:Uncharacterized protein n=1 Tax=Sporothrix bragantina TaxID=671064 RepID=A0ABP0BQ54_9PEZI
MVHAFEVSIDEDTWNRWNTQLDGLDYGVCIGAAMDEEDDRDYDGTEYVGDYVW